MTFFGLASMAPVHLSTPPGQSPRLAGKFFRNGKKRDLSGAGVNDGPGDSQSRFFSLRIRYRKGKYMNELMYFDPAVLRSDSVAIYTAAGFSREAADPGPAAPGFRVANMISVYYNAVTAEPARSVRGPLIKARSVLPRSEKRGLFRRTGS